VDSIFQNFDITPVKCFDTTLDKSFLELNSSTVSTNVLCRDGKESQNQGSLKDLHSKVTLLIFLNLIIPTSNSGVVAVFCFLGVLINLLIPFVT